MPRLHQGGGGPATPRKGRELKDDQILTLLTEHNDIAVKAFKRMTSEVAALREEIKILRQIVASGAQLEFPWFKLPAPRRKQVEAVIVYLQQHRNRAIFTVRRAARDTFLETEGGYPNALALAAYCYEIKLENWITDTS